MQDSVNVNPFMDMINALFVTFLPLMIIFIVVQVLLKALGINLFDLFGLGISGFKPSKGHSDIADAYNDQVNGEPSDKYRDNKPNYSQVCFKCGEDRHRGEKYCNQCGWEFE